MSKTKFHSGKFGHDDHHHDHGSDDRGVKLKGSNGNDELTGTELNDLLFGGKGNDLLTGLGGNDKLKGGKGDDRLLGGDGDDRLDGGKGDDFLDGGAGNDIVKGGKGDDIANFTLSENLGAQDVYDGGKGCDTLRLTLTTAEAKLAEGEIAAFRAFPEHGGKVFHFDSLGLTVRNFEKLEIVEIVDNTAPVAVDDTAVTNEDTPVVGNALANDTDVDNDTLTATLVAGPVHGALSFNTDGSFNYVPNADFNGTDSFTYVANDGALDSDPATVNLTVNSVNDAPVAVGDLATTNEDTPVDGNVLANDTDVEDGRPALISAVNGAAGNVGATITLASGALLTVGADGNFSYDPNGHFEALGAGEIANDSFTYVATDSLGAPSDIATVNLTITGVDDAPAAIRVAVVGGDATTYVQAAGQLDPDLFVAVPISSGAYTSEDAWARELAAYDVVVLGGSGISPGTDYTQTSLFAALEQFVIGGGGVVTTGWFAQTLSSNSIVWDSLTLGHADSITPITSAGFNYVGLNAEIAVSDPTHAIVSGLAAYPYQSNAQYHELALAIDAGVGAISLATGSGGTAIAYDEQVGSGRTAYVGGTYLANGAYSPETTRDGVSDQVFEQTVTWAAGGSSATVLGASPTSIESTALLLTGDEPQPADQFYFEDLPVTGSQGSDADNIDLEFAIAQVGNDPVEYQSDASDGIVTADSWDYADNDAFTGTAVTADVDLF